MTKAKTARISKEALEDSRLGADELGLLLYLMNSETINPATFRGEEIADHFGKARKWFSRHYRILISCGYAKRHDTHDAEGKRLYLYAISDRPGALDDPRISEQLFQNSKVKLKRIYGTVKSDALQSSVQSRSRNQVEISGRPAIRYEDYHPSKFLKPEYQTNEHVELYRFYWQYGFAVPKTDREWEEARKPGIRSWAEVTETAIDWQAARLVNKMLKEPINKEVLEYCWERWTASSYRKERAVGVLEWYEALVKDRNAKPWLDNINYQKKKGGKPNARYQRPTRKPVKQHGRASGEYKEEDFSPI